MSDPKAKGMQMVLARNECWERFKRNSKRLTTSMLGRYKQIKIENPKRKTLISNTIVISSIDSCNFYLEMFMICTRNQRLNTKIKCWCVAAMLWLPSSLTFRSNYTEVKLMYSMKPTSEKRIKTYSDSLPSYPPYGDFLFCCTISYSLFRRLQIWWSTRCQALFTANSISKSIGRKQCTYFLSCLYYINRPINKYKIDIA